METQALSHADLIVALGGGARISADFADLGVDLDPVVFRERVYKWKGADRIPHKWRPLFDILAKRRGIQMGPEFLLPIQHKND